GKHAVLNFQSRLIYDYALRENSASLQDRMILIATWRNESKDWESEPIYLDAENQIQKKSLNEFSIEDGDIKFIWVKETEETKE
ncbi:17144_t:CDS:2, partial [Gigaspora margarita]